jgi:uncharacterized protein YdhG (YjbR/CyaY superfamily)
MPQKPTSIDEYLAAVTAEKRAALEALRAEIASAAPDAEECISYDVPTFRLDGKMLVSFAAAANHLAFYAGADPIRTHEAELRGFDTAKGTVRFQPDRPLPAEWSGSS